MLKLCRRVEASQPMRGDAPGTRVSGASMNVCSCHHPCPGRVPALVLDMRRRASAGRRSAVTYPAAAVMRQAMMMECGRVTERPRHGAVGESERHRYPEASVWRKSQRTSGGT